VWAPLIEKAFAKLHGCYESLGRGSIEQGLRCLTGIPLVRTPLTGLEPKSDSDGGFADKESERRRQDLWAKMKKWHGRGCVMGCYRGVEFDRARNRQATSNNSSMGPFGGDGGGGPGRRQTGLMAGRGYGIRTVCEASAGATPTRDAAMFQLVELSCPWGVGQWRGDWSRNSGMWDAYPSIKSELCRLREQRAGSAAPPPGADKDKDGDGGGGAGAWGGVTEATAVGAGGGAREQQEEDEEEEGSSFWMTFDDFTTEFSQARHGMLTCVSYSTGQESRGLSRKSYRGVWIPGDPLTGSGGGCASPSFLQNPFYPVTIQRNSTTVTVCLSIWDRAWQVDPAGRGPAIGYYIVRLTGSKPRLTKLRPGKIAARSMAFVAGTQSAGEHTFDSGRRYAIVPVTVRPLSSAEEFYLDLTADNTVEWEQMDDRIRDLDQVLRLSDDEGDTPSGKLPGGKHPSAVSVLSEEVADTEDVDGPPGNKVAEALHEQIADLSSLIAELKKEALHQDIDPGSRPFVDEGA
ncbi:unnamed protein product, partial [Ectocarpus fasciculatus]